MEKVIKEVIKLTEEKCDYKTKYELTYELASGYLKEYESLKETFAKYFIKKDYMPRIDNDGEYIGVSSMDVDEFVKNGGDAEVLLKVHKEMYDSEIEVWRKAHEQQ